MKESKSILYWHTKLYTASRNYWRAFVHCVDNLSHPVSNSSSDARIKISR